MKIDFFEKFIAQRLELHTQQLRNYHVHGAIEL